MFWDQTIVDVLFFGLEIEVKFFGLLAALTALSMYYFYIKAMVKDESDPNKSTPPRSTWFMWLLLDIVAFSSRLCNGIFDALLLAYVAGTVVVAFLTIPYGRKGWTKLETFCTGAVALSIAVWLMAGPVLATICALGGLTVASIPLIIRVFRGEYENLTAWILAIVSSSFNLLDGQLLTGIWFVALQLFVVAPIIYYWKWLPWREKIAA